MCFKSKCLILNLKSNVQPKSPQRLILSLAERCDVWIVNMKNFSIEKNIHSSAQQVI